MQPQDTTQPTFIKLGKNAKDITGQRFGRLIALGPVGRTSHSEIMWLCQCDCGQTTIVRAASLRKTQSCGCLTREVAVALGTKHGMFDKPIYNVWVHITQRCTNPKNKSYKNYGGRGITVCDEWLNSFESFYGYVSSLPDYGKEGYTIDRINNDGHYEIGNVKWSTATEQARNTRHNRLLTFNGKTQCVTAWEDEMGLNRHQIYWRLHKGWSADKAISTPSRKKAKRKN